MNGKRITALILMIVSVILTLLLAVGIVGVWVARGEATHAVTALSQGVEQGLTITLDRLNRLDGQLVQAGYPLNNSGEYCFPSVAHSTPCQCGCA